MSATSHDATERSDEHWELFKSLHYSTNRNPVDAGNRRMTRGASSTAFWKAGAF